MNEMLDFVKALSNADRLRIVGELTTCKSASIKEIAESLNLPFREVFNHLAFLEHLGVVRQENEQYILNPDGVEALARRHCELVVDPAMVRIPEPGVAVLGRDVHAGRTGRMLEILQAPSIGFADRHGTK